MIEKQTGMSVFELASHQSRWILINLQTQKIKLQENK